MKRTCIPAGLLRGRLAPGAAAAAACAAAAWLASCDAAREGRGGVGAPVSISFTAMGTFAGMTLANPDAELEEPAFQAMRDAFREVEENLSVFLETSDIYRLNRCGGESVAVSPMTRGALEAAARHWRMTKGAFDVTIGPFMRLWGFRGGSKPEAEPGAEALAAAMRLTGMNLLEVSGDGARLAREGAAVDLGGMAKGYAVDLCCERLEALGVADALVDLGGNIKCLGLAPGNEAWRIGVQSPFAGGSLLGTLSLSNGMATATSGNYERFLEIAGRRYAHIMDPRTGRPAQGMAGVTVVCDSAGDADVLSTALFVLGPDAGAEVLRRYKARGAIFIPDKRPLEMWITPGIESIFSPAPEAAGRIRRLNPRPD